MRYDECRMLHERIAFMIVLNTTLGLFELNFPQFPTRSDTSVEWVVSWLDGWLVAFDALPAISVS